MAAATNRSDAPSGDLAMNPGTRAASKGSTLSLAELEAEARYARERYELYRAKAYGPRLTSAARLRELHRRSEFAEARLDRTKADHRAGAAGRTGRR
jgi:hypothetical protein